MSLGRTILITGASRGIGLEMVRQLVAAPTKRTVLAACRKPDEASELQSLRHTSSTSAELVVLKLDVDDFESYPLFVGRVEKVLSQQSVAGHPQLSCLINNAGVAPKSTRYSVVDADQMLDTYRTNVVAPLLLTKHLLPFLKAGVATTGNPGLVANVSSILGSINLNNSGPQPSSPGGSASQPSSTSPSGAGGGLYPYRASKAALNMVTRSLSIDLNHLNVRVVSVHPGWVRTDLGGPKAPLSPQESVSGVLDVLNNFKDSYNGSLVDYRGQVLPF